jgi:SAM-dependent methyltransferase
MGLGMRTMNNPRMRWIRADLRDERWHEALAPASFDAVLTSTTSHWLDPGVLRLFYRRAASLLKAGGVFANADLIPPGDAASTIGRIAIDRLFRWQSARSAEVGETWASFWNSVEATAEFHPLVAQRRELLGARPPRVFLRASEHALALRDAGFRDVQEVWRWHAVAVLVAHAGPIAAKARFPEHGSPVDSMGAEP